MCEHQLAVHQIAINWFGDEAATTEANSECLGDNAFEFSWDSRCVHRLCDVHVVVPVGDLNITGVV